MKIRSVLWCLFVALSGAVVAGTAANTLADSQPAQQSPTSEKPRALIRSVEGADLYREYCASCHGKNGKGDGPVARSKGHGARLDGDREEEWGKFPTARVRRIIEGEGMIASHGTREMPVWGPIFSQVEADVDREPVRIENLLKYLESIQAISK
ncbi:MAG: cytochrome c [Candidatus Acidiferrales bacterium]